MFLLHLLVLHVHRSPSLTLLETRNARFVLPVDLAQSQLSVNLHVPSVLKEDFQPIMDLALVQIARQGRLTMISVVRIANFALEELSVQLTQRRFAKPVQRDFCSLRKANPCVLVV